MPEKYCIIHSVRILWDGRGTETDASGLEGVVCLSGSASMGFEGQQTRHTVL